MQLLKAVTSGLNAKVLLFETIHNSACEAVAARRPAQSVEALRGKSAHIGAIPMGAIGEQGKETGMERVKSWCPDVERGAMEQARNLSALPFVHGHVALMPDCHQGYGMPIGGVIACDGVIIPNAVGVDIGCGMNLSVYDFAEEISTEKLREICDKIRERIPVGFSHHTEPGWIPERMPEPLKEHRKNAELSIGTLGGGNHFIELQRDDANRLRVMIHSGSRNLGKQICDKYDGIAKAINGKQFGDLAWLSLDSSEGEEYLECMTYAIEYARLNREGMAYQVYMVMCSVIGNVGITFLDCAHNYARIETHFGKSLCVHRKGAISADVGEIGIIPGSQGTCSYVVRGLGNPDSFKSCSHGAGRKMGRGQAKKTLNLEHEIANMDSRGIVHNIKSIEDLDEAAGAYKDIDEVMENQKDLCEIIKRLTPIAVIKG